jgi:hypothetical protein
VSTLERRTRMLLRAYPPAYRRDRGEEILGTLLEATPPGRTWPVPRDAWSLIRGGLAARAARNRQVSLAASLRQAALLGFALFLSKDAGEQLQDFSFAHSVAAGLVPLLAGCLPLAAVAAAWFGRRAPTMIAAIAACPVLAWREYTLHQNLPFLRLPSQAQTSLIVWLVLALLSLAGIVLLTRATERPAPTWLSLPGLALALMVLERFWHYQGSYHIPHDQLGTSVVGAFVPTLCWLVIDVRPALGLAVFLLVSEILAVVNGLQTSVILNESARAFWQAYGTNLESLALAAAITAAGVWLLRRQTRMRPSATS